MTTAPAGTQEAPKVDAPPVVKGGVADGKSPVVPAEGVKEPVKDQALEVDPLEKEVSEKYGEDWAKLSDKIKAQVLSAERKTRDADKKYQQVARIQKNYDLSQQQMSKLVDLLKTNPRAILQNPALGIDVKKLAEEVLWEQIQLEEMDPKDRELADMKRIMAERDAADAKAKEEREAAELSQKESAAKEKFLVQINSAIADAKLPNTPKVVAQMAYYMRLAKNAGKEIDMKAVSERVRKDFMDWQGQFLESSSDDELMNLVPKSVLEKIRKADLAEMRKKGLVPKPGPKPSAPKPEPRTKESVEEWIERMRRERGAT